MKEETIIINRAKEVKQKVVSKEFGISATTVSNVVNGMELSNKLRQRVREAKTGQLPLLKPGDILCVDHEAKKLTIDSHSGIDSPIALEMKLERRKGFVASDTASVPISGIANIIQAYEDAIKLSSHKWYNTYWAGWGTCLLVQGLVVLGFYIFK